MNALATIGPVTVAVDARDWYSYRSGIFDNCYNFKLILNHRVLVVGYGVTTTGTKYW